MKYFILGVKALPNVLFCYKPQVATKQNISDSENGWTGKPGCDSFGLKIVRVIVEADNCKEAKSTFKTFMKEKGFSVSYIDLSKLWLVRQYSDTEDRIWKSGELSSVKSHEELMKFIFMYPGFKDFNFTCRCVENENSRLLLINTKRRSLADTIASASERKKNRESLQNMRS